MTCAAALSVALTGLDGQLVEVEAATGGGLPRTVVVGLPDAALNQARERCRAAVASVGVTWPQQLLTINLTPATLPKSGSHYDLAIIAATLATMKRVPDVLLPRCVLLGEVKLSGEVVRVRGILPALLVARREGIEMAVVPAGQEAEARLVEGITIWSVGHVRELIELLHGRPVLHPVPAEPQAPVSGAQQKDLADVVGQEEGRYALEVAAAGRHHLFFTGPPGQGKTMLAERLPSILPDLSAEESLEVSGVQSLLGDTVLDRLATRPPFCDPHPNISLPGLVGGGTRVAGPGAISRAHRGVLFLDEAPEFPGRVLDALRAPLESGWVTINRSAHQVRFPARFQLVMAANPCKCGQAGSVTAECSCSPFEIRRYRERLSGPILDRIDLQISLPPVRTPATVLDQPTGEPSAAVLERVNAARQRQSERLGRFGVLTNAELSGHLLRHELPTPEGIELLDQALMRGELSVRGVDKVLRIAWTIADLAGSSRVTRPQLHTALMLRRAASGTDLAA